MASADTIQMLHEMRLSVMASCYRDQASAPGAADMTFDERFSDVVCAEYFARRDNKRTRLLRAACLPFPDARTDGVMYLPDRGLDRPQILELSNCAWVDERLNVIVTGASGSGKTWLACALGAAACETFHTARYARMPQMLDELAAARDDSWLRAKKKYESCDVLIVDDWLLEPVEGAAARELLEIVEARHRRRSTIMCSQFAASGWHDKIGPGAVADAVVDRLIYNSHSIHIKGDESMRKRVSR